MASPAEVAELRRQLRELKQAFEESDRHVRESDRRAEQAERQLRKTTLDEYMTLCQELLFSSLRIQPDRTSTSEGGITDPKNTFCPTTLLPWQHFLEEQSAVFDTIYELFPLGARLFMSQSGVAAIASDLSMGSICDERTLKSFMQGGIERPVTRLIDQLQQVESVRSAFNLGDGIVFQNHPHAISDAAEEVVQRATQTPDHKSNLHQLRPDQMCVYKSANGERKMAYVVEYKAPHKLTPLNFRAGLGHMNIYRDVVNRATIPSTSDEQGRFQYQSEKLVASALTQTYHYMIEDGLDYGLLTTGEVIVFLKVDWADPGSLYYHLAEPGPESAAHPQYVQFSSAVGQYLAFSLMALGARRDHGQDERVQAMETLQRWAVDFEMTLRSIPASERTTPDSGSVWEPTTYEDFDRSPAARKRRRRRSSMGDQGHRVMTRRVDPSSSDDVSFFRRPPDTPSPEERRSKTTRGTQGDGRRSERVLARRAKEASDNEEQERQYCAQKCLAGLVDGGELDPRCPNVQRHSHRQSAKETRHPVDHTTWLQLLAEQLRQTLDSGVVKLHKHGARGVLFKVTLLEYGYTVVCKGTVEAFIPELEHEAAVYGRLRRLQGKYVPVFLGAIDLRPLKRTYYYDHRVYVVHMSFMSWGGEEVGAKAKDEDQDQAAALKLKVTAALWAIHAEGVVHNDVRSVNMLVNKEADSVMMIDFERSVLRKPVRLPLTSVSQTASRKRASSSLSTQAGERKRQRHEAGSSRMDIRVAESLFDGSGGLDPADYR